MEADRDYYREICASAGKAFRGQIWENCSRFTLVGGGYKSMPTAQRGHFKIESARHLEGPLRALLDPNVEIVGVAGATQVMKSVLIDILIPYIMEHDPRNTIVYFEDDPKAKLFADSRLMHTIRGHPVISKWIKEVDRHKASNTRINLPGMFLEICGLNQGNTSSAAWPMVIVSEAWQHGADGLLRLAIKRADRFVGNGRKVLIESQPGMVGEDWHTEAEAMHKVPLTWACPECGGRQEWDFFAKRPEDFKPTVKDSLSVPKPGTYAGMRFDAEGEIEERAASAVWECFHCGFLIRDVRPVRKGLMDSYRQDYQINGVSPKAVCFYIPREAATGNTFRDSVANYLSAKAAQDMGNMVPLENWFMSERAVFYDPRLAQPKITSNVGSYDLTEIIKDEHHRGMVIDCQKHLELDTVGTFWYECWVAAKNGDSFQLERGFVDSFDKLTEIQKRWKIQNRYVCIDGRKWTPEILRQCAARAELVDGQFLGHPCKMWSSWIVLLGDAPARHYQHPDKVYRVWSMPTRRLERIVEPDGKARVVPVLMYRWSNLSVKDQVNDLRIGGDGKPKFAALAREQCPPETQAKEVGDLTFENQMSAEVRTEKNGKAYWEKLRPGNHYWDLACMRLVRMNMDGLAGHQVTVEN
jgi:hypothetical protein